MSFVNDYCSRLLNRYIDDSYYIAKTQKIYYNKEDLDEAIKIYASEYKKQNFNTKLHYSIKLSKDKEKENDYGDKLSKYLKNILINDIDYSVVELLDDTTVFIDENPIVLQKNTKIGIFNGVQVLDHKFCGMILVNSDNKKVGLEFTRFYIDSNSKLPIIIFNNTSLKMDEGIKSSMEQHTLAGLNKNTKIRVGVDAKLSYVIDSERVINICKPEIFKVTF